MKLHNGPLTEADQETDTPVAIIADLPNDTPEAAGLSLASHLTLWRALRGVAAEHQNASDDDAIEELAEMAQRRCGVELQDREIRLQFVGRLRSRIMPAAAARACIGTLRESDVKFSVWGINWKDEESIEDRYPGPIPHGPARQALLTATRVVVLPTTGMAAVQTALDALAMGRLPLLSFIFRNAKAIPIASAKEDKQLMDEAFDKVDAELAAGHIVCIFPEGGITNDGEIQRFRRGIETIIARRPVPVIPSALGRLWGSWFSRRRGGGVRRIPGRLFARVPVVFGAAVAPEDVSAEKLELLVRTLRGELR